MNLLLINLEKDLSVLVVDGKAYEKIMKHFHDEDQMK